MIPPRNHDVTSLKKQRCRRSVYYGGHAAEALLASSAKGGAVARFGGF